MADPDPRNTDDPQHEETTEPHNPPNSSIVQPGARRGWLVSSLGTVVLLFAIVAAVFAWVVVQRSLGSGPLHRSDPQVTGTAGTRDDRIRSDNSPGGFNPTPRPGSTDEELRMRGSNETTIARLDDATTGSRVTLSDVRVERADGDAFTIRDGNATATVVVPGGMPTVQAGQRVTVSGTIEATGATPRIRASRIDVR